MLKINSFCLLIIHLLHIKENFGHSVIPQWSFISREAWYELKSYALTNYGCILQQATGLSAHDFCQFSQHAAATSSASFNLSDSSTVLSMQSRKSALTCPHTVGTAIYSPSNCSFTTAKSLVQEQETVNKSNILWFDDCTEVTFYWCSFCHVCFLRAVWT